MNLIKSILRRTVANMDAATEAHVRQVTSEPLHLAFVPTPEEQAEGKAHKATGRKQGRPKGWRKDQEEHDVDNINVISKRDGNTKSYGHRGTRPAPFDPNMDPVTRARLEPRSRAADAARARRRRRGWVSSPRRPGPLEAAYDSSAVSPQLKAAGRITQLIVIMKPLYAAGDRAGFDRYVPEFDWLSDLLEDEPGWGLAIRRQLFPTFSEVKP